MIGIFDSGSGGLSVYREIARILPEQRYIYVSDSAHCPYGGKSAEYIRGRAAIISEFLSGRGCEVIVVACNTATAAAISYLRQTYPIPFIGMEPAVKPAALSTRSGVIGVLATEGTLKASNYLDLRDSLPDGLRVVDCVGKGFVELVENGDLTSPHAEQTVRESVSPLLEQGADVLVLGCTHYPFLRPMIEKVAADFDPERKVDIIDPAPAVARQLIRVMHAHGLLPDSTCEQALSLSGAAEGAAPYRISEEERRRLDLYSSGDLKSLERILALIRT